MFVYLFIFFLAGFEKDESFFKEKERNGEGFRQHSLHMSVM